MLRETRAILTELMMVKAQDKLPARGCCGAPSWPHSGRC